jgi:hypothetical protein
MIGLQERAATIVVNAFNGQSNNTGAVKVLTTHEGNVALQCDAFVAAVEQFAVGYCVDDALLDMFRQSSTVADVIRRADTFVAGQMYVAPGVMPESVSTSLINMFRLRAWGAKGSSGVMQMPSVFAYPSPGLPPKSYSATSDNAIDFALKGMRFGRIVPAPAHSLLVHFNESTTLVPTGVQWSMYRFSFPYLQADSYELSPAEDWIPPSTPSSTRSRRRPAPLQRLSGRRTRACCGAQAWALRGSTASISHHARH